MRKQINLIVFLLIIFLLFLMPIANSSSLNEKNGFELNTFLIKSVIKQGETSTNELKIQNTESFEQEFTISLTGIDDLVSVSETTFSLKEGEFKILKITFEDKSSDSLPGVYVGKMLIKYDSKVKEIPIILEIQSKNILFATNLDVPPQSKELSAGEDSVTNIRFFNLKDSGTHNVEVNYYIKNFEGQTFLSETESIVIGSELVITKTLTLPKNIPKGEYVIFVVTKYADSTSTSSYMFSVVNRSINLFNDGTNLLIILILVFLIGVIILVIYMIRERDQLFVHLRMQQTSEIKRNIKLIKEQEKICKKIKNKKEKKKKIRFLKKAKKIIISKIKIKQKKQRQELKKLKKKGKKSEITKKMKSWEKEGYKMSELLGETRGLSNFQAKKEIDKWRKQGYDTSFLKR